MGWGDCGAPKAPHIVLARHLLSTSMQEHGCPIHGKGKFVSTATTRRVKESDFLPPWGTSVFAAIYYTLTTLACPREVSKAITNMKWKKRDPK